MRYTVKQAILEAAWTCEATGDWSPCTIRCTINDLLDAAEKGGYKVNHKYSQERAVKLVRSKR